MRPGGKPFDPLDHPSTCACRRCVAIDRELDSLGIVLRCFANIPAEPYVEPARNPDGTRVVPPEWHQRLGVGPGSFTQVVTNMLYREVRDP